MQQRATPELHLHPDAHAARAERDRRLSTFDFDSAPFTIAWEITRSCAYACAHCRADAQPRRDPRELDTAEGLSLIHISPSRAGTR